jgi:putative lipoprotein (rSAM/lipoprotein system)
MARRISILRTGLLKAAGSVVSAVLTALGVSSCGGTNPVTPCYGVPSVDFRVIGHTLAARDSMPVGSIRVVLSTIQASDTTAIDSAYTVETGLYGFSFLQEGDVDYNDFALYVRADDPVMGLYASADTLIPITPDSVADGEVNIPQLDFYLQPDTTGGGGG